MAHSKAESIQVEAAVSLAACVLGMCKGFIYYKYYFLQWGVTVNTAKNYSWDGIL